MGLFDFFNRKSPLEKHAERAANKRAQNPDRWESIVFLGRLATTPPPASDEDQREAAVAALMERFTFYVDPTITDGEEKEETFSWVCQAGALAVEPARAALESYESLSWPLKVLEHLLDEDAFIETMITRLQRMGTDYERDPQRKIQLLCGLEAKRHATIVAAVAPFFSDANEESRFHAIGAALEQDNLESVIAELTDALRLEDSVRVKVRTFDRLSQLDLSLGPEAKEIELPEGYSLDADAIPRKKAARTAAAPAATKAAAPARPNDARTPKRRGGKGSKKRKRR